MKKEDLAKSDISDGDSQIYQSFIYNLEDLSKNYILAEILTFEISSLETKNDNHLQKEWVNFVSSLVEIIIFPKNMRGFELYKHRILKSIIFAVFSQKNLSYFRKDPDKFLFEIESLKKTISHIKNLFFSKNSELSKFFGKEKLRKNLETEDKKTGEEKKNFRAFFKNILRFLRIGEAPENDELSELIENCLRGEKSYVELSAKLSVNFTKNEIRKYNILNVIQPFLLNLMEIFSLVNERFAKTGEISRKFFLLVKNIVNKKKSYFADSQEMLCCFVKEIISHLEEQKTSSEISEEINSVIEKNLKKSVIDDPNYSSEKKFIRAQISEFKEILSNISQIVISSEKNNSFFSFLKIMSEFAENLKKNLFTENNIVKMNNFFEIILILKPDWKKTICKNKIEEYIGFSVNFSEFLASFVPIQLKNQNNSRTIFFDLINCPKFYKIFQKNNILLKNTILFILSEVFCDLNEYSEKVSEKNLQVLWEIVFISMEARRKNFSEEKNQLQFFLNILANKKFHQIFLENFADNRSMIKFLFEKYYKKSFESDKIDKIVNLTYKLSKIASRADFKNEKKQNVIAYIFEIVKNQEFLYLLKKNSGLIKEVILVFASEHSLKFEENYLEKINFIFDLIKILGENKSVFAEDFNPQNFISNIVFHRSFQKIILSNSKIRLVQEMIMFLFIEYDIDIKKEFVEKLVSYFSEIIVNKNIYNGQKRNINLFELLQKLAKDLLVDPEKIKIELLPFLSCLFNNISKILENKVDSEREDILQNSVFWLKNFLIQKNFSDEKRIIKIINNPLKNRKPDLVKNIVSKEVKYFINEKLVKNLKIFSKNAKLKFIITAFNKLRPSFAMFIRKKIELVIKSILEDKNKILNQQKLGIFLECSKKIVQELIINSNKDEYYLLNQVFGGLSSKNFFEIETSEIRSKVNLSQEAQKYLMDYLSDKLIESFFKVGIINSLEKNRLRKSLELIRNLLKENVGNNFNLYDKMLKILAKKENSEIFSEAILEVINSLAILWNKFSNIKDLEIDHHVQEFYRKLFLKERIFEKKMIFCKKELKNILININCEKIKSIMGINAEDLFFIEKIVKNLNMTGYIFNQNQNILLIVENLSISEINLSKTFIENVYFNNCKLENNILKEASWENLKFRNFTIRNIKFGDFKKLLNIVFVNDRIFCRSKFVECDFSEIKNIETLIFTGKIEFEKCFFTKEQNYFLLLQKNLKFKNCYIKEQTEKFVSRQPNAVKNKIIFYRKFKENQYYI